MQPVTRGVGADGSPISSSVVAAIRGGRTVYGRALGIIMLDTKFPRLRGDIGNARTWPFPVSYRIVEGAIPERMAQADPDPELIEPFVEAARTLEAEGVRAICTSCGFLAVNQPELAAAVDIPVFSSPLLQVPVAATAAGGRTVVLLTARTVLTENHYRGAGWSSADIPVVQMAPPEDSHFYATFVGNAPEADTELLEREVADLARRVVTEHPDAGAIVMECANFPPFGQTVRSITGLPVFDLYTMGMYAYLVGSGTEFPPTL